MVVFVMFICDFLPQLNQYLPIPGTLRPLDLKEIPLIDYRKVHPWPYSGVFVLKDAHAHGERA